MIEVINPESICHDHDRPGCLKTPDPAFTLSFQDIGEKDLYFCSHCGPEAKLLADKFDAIAKTSLDLIPILASIIEEVEEKVKKERN